MESYRFQHVSFTYPKGTHRVLCDLNFTVSRGEFLLLCGPSGCGKSTLLRHLKTCLTPHGTMEGQVFFEGTVLGEVSQKDQAQKIGFVLQSPENQVVTDQVWHELAFGLESLGCDTPTIRRRVAEIAAFFGIEGWFHREISQLSGGQKQTLALAAIMAMQPSVLVLDEPTSQLDPIAASEFLALLGKINRELGTTIILTEHRLEEVFPFATRIIVLQEGQILCDDTPEQVGHRLRERGNQMFLAMPTAMRVWAALDTKLDCPTTVRDGSNFLTAWAQEHPLHSLPEEVLPVEKGEPAVTVKEAWFRYEKDTPDIVKGLNLTVMQGEFFALLGGNGAGKTTALKLMAGIQTPYRGQVKLTGKLGYLPQNPQMLFVRKTIREDLYEVFHGSGVLQEQQGRQIARVVHLCGLEEILDHHPYDVSGGEQQRAALAKVLLTEPEILLLDEPTKGFDAQFKATFAAILKRLMAQGVTILMVSHDVAFCARYAHRCGLFFDGNVVAQGRPRTFFSGNSFYTTPANRMARHLLPEAVTVEDVIAACGGTVEQEELPEQDEASLPPPPKQEGAQGKPLSLWRKIVAGLSVLAALGIFVYSTWFTNQAGFVEGGIVTAEGKVQLGLYVLLTAACVLFLLVTHRRGTAMELLPVAKGKLTKRTGVAAALLLLCVPLTILAGVYWLDGKHYNMIALLVLLECMIPFLLVFEGRRPQARELVIIAVLCAIGVAGRGLLFMLPQIKPVTALTIISGIAFGGETGFLVGAVTMLTSNMLFSQGPWTPWQMFSMGIIGFVAGILFRKGRLRCNTGTLAVFGCCIVLILYGGIMNFSSAITWNAQNLTPEILLAYYMSGLPMDLVHAVSTSVFLILAARPMLEKLERVKQKYGLV